MRKSIRKFASLCLALAMILSVLAMPALAEMKAVHRCVFDNYISSDQEVDPTYYDNDQHRYGIFSHYACDCGKIESTITSYHYENHIVVGEGEFAFSTTNGEYTITYYRFTCPKCNHSFTIATDGP